jgi:hypothetical protein
MYMNEMQHITELAMEVGMQKAYVQILHRMIKNSSNNQFTVAEADRILAESNTANERAKVQAKAQLQTIKM